MSQPTSSALPFRSDCPTSSEQQLPRQPHDTGRRRSIAHESLWSLASTFAEDGCKERSPRRKSCSDAAPFKLPSVSLPFLRSATSTSLPVLRSANTIEQGRTTPSDDVVHASPPQSDRLECLNDTATYKTRVFRKSPYLTFLGSADCDASETQADCLECLNDTTDRTPNVFRKSPYQRQKSKQGRTTPSEDDWKWLSNQLDEEEDRAHRVYYEDLGQLGQDEPASG